MKKINFNDNKNIISKQLKLARINAGLTQSQLAAKMQVLNINIDQQMISKIENNMRIVTDYELVCFCEILGIDEKTLLKDYYSQII
ncbi:MAG: helix-turn-helix domain-containing protein [Oscillospiraceae bacterium]|nr:helix-turn-helix domain-containing protein [Oscillospiraceae bacterium]